MNTNRLIGAFVSVAGGLSNCIVNGENLGVNSIMIHATPPQRWCRKTIPEEKTIKFSNLIKNSNIKQVFIHAIYLINLASPDERIYNLSKLSLYNYLELSNRINSNGVIIHTGSLKNTNENDGFNRVNRAIEWVFDKLDGKGKLILEVAAGAGRVIGSDLNDLKIIRNNSKYKKNITFCLDTQHLFASGYDVKNDLENVLEQVDDILSIDKISIIHFNDSKTELGSNRDRHENIGEGLIGAKAMKKILNNPKLIDIPFIMETPALKSFDTAIKEVKKLQSWAE